MKSSRWFDLAVIATPVDGAPSGVRDGQHGRDPGAGSLQDPHRLIRGSTGGDDVVTTGATADESVRVLQTAGARVTAVLTVAHA